MSTREAAASRRMAFKKSYTIETADTKMYRRSLIADAKLEKKVNAECAEMEKRKSKSEEDEVEELQSHSIVLVLVGRPLSAMATACKLIEDCCHTLEHVETRPSAESKTSTELYVRVRAQMSHLRKAISQLESSEVARNVQLVESRDLVYEPVWYPRHISELDHCTGVESKFQPDMDTTHPGWTDSEYRERRAIIADIAYKFRHGDRIPNVEYTKDETATWGIVYNSLACRIDDQAHSAFSRNFRILEEMAGYSPEAVPQLAAVSEFLQRRSGFQLRPVSGLLSARDFLSSLAFRVFQCTQYIRHPASPHHTPEPDCIHELLGHVPLLADPDFALFSQELGLAAIGSDDDAIEKLATLYWFTVEFGLCRENGSVKAIGAGLLSSYGELEHALSDVPEKRTLDMVKACHQEYQDQEYQPIYFVANSFEDMKQALRQFVNRYINRPFEVHYDPWTQSVISLTKAKTCEELIKKNKDELAKLQAASNNLDRVLSRQSTNSD